MNRLCMFAFVVTIAGCIVQNRPPTGEATRPTTDDSKLPTPAYATPRVPWASAGIDWTTPPTPLATTPYIPPTATEFSLKNGLRVVLIENHRLPLVSMRLSIIGDGTHSAPLGIAALTADLLDEGAGNFTAETLPEQLEKLGANLSTGANHDKAFVELDSVADSLPNVLSLLADVVLRPRFSEADFKRVKADHLESLRTRGDNPRAVASLVYDKVVYPGTFYAEPVDGFIDSTAKLNLEQVKDFWRRNYMPRRATLVVAGDVTAESLRQMLSNTLDAWKPAVIRFAKPTIRLPQKTRQGIFVVDRPDAPQSVVYFGVRTTLSPANYDAEELINTALGGSFSSRLNGRLREELGYTYGINSAFVRRPLMNSWTVRTSLRTDVTAAGIKEALAIIEGTRTTALPPTEFDKARQLTVRQFPQGFETNDSLVSVFSELIDRNRPLTDYAGFEARQATLTPASVQAAITDLWQNLSIVIVGDWSAIQADVTKLGLPVTVVSDVGVPVAAP